MTEPPVDDAAWAPPRPAAPDAASLLPGYRDFELVARGGDSVVYRAHQDALDRDVAVKVVLLDDAESIARFQRELAITVRLGRQHPNIMTVLATGTTTAGQPCLVMDYVEHGSLHNRLAERGPLPVSEVVAAGSVVADALAFAHGQGVLHRDVKPQNVLVLPTSYVLADFGLARAIDAGHSSSLERFSYRHASPQILDGEAPTVADDVYSLGSTMFTLLDGRPPFAAADPDEDSALSYLRRARTEHPRRLERDDVPRRLVDVVARCLARDRADRFAGAAELRDALDAIPTESRSWAPEPAPTAAPPGGRGPTVDDEPTGEISSGPNGTAAPAAPAVAASGGVAPAAAAVPPVVAPPVAPPVPPPPSRPADAVDAPAVSALAHLGPAAVHRDAESTGLRPAERPPPAAPPAPAPAGNRRWLVVVAAGVVALAVGLFIGIYRAGGSADPGASPTAHTTSRPLGQPIPTISVQFPGPIASAIIDPTMKPAITSMVRKDGNLQLSWTDPSRGRYGFVIFLVGEGQVDGLPYHLDPGVTRASLSGFPAGRYCLLVATITTNENSKAVFGPGPQRCVG